MNRKIIYIAAVILVSLTCCGKDQIYITESDNDTFLDSDKVSVSVPIENHDSDSIYAQITGAVVNPGVYELPQDSRIYELVELAGGFTSEAASDYVNQVSKLSDGQMIRIPTVSEYERDISQKREDNSGLVNINTASLADLMTLPGIGENKALAIISYREKNGAYGSVEDLCNVPGIKEGTLSKFRDKITVN